MAPVLLTGTPGTGKSTAAKAFSFKTGHDIIHINEEVGADYLSVEDGSKVVDIEVLSEKIGARLTKNCVVDGHLSHLLSLEGIVIVLRTNPRELEKRLVKKGFSKRKIAENLEAEALDVCLVESLERYDDVFEIDTTGRDLDYVTDSISNILHGKTDDFSPGGISWLEEYLK